MSGSPGPPSATAVLLRGAASVALAGVGLVLAERWLASGVLVGPANRIYLALLGFLVGWLASAWPARGAARAIRDVARRIAAWPPDAVLAGTAGATLALLLTVLLDDVLERIPGMNWGVSLALATGLSASFVAFFVANRRLLPLPRAAAAPSSDDAGPIRVLDTSAIIDGRIADVADANFLHGEAWVPAFVVRELQGIADDADATRRRRGRRGLAMLERLGEVRGLALEVLDDAATADLPDGPVDDRLVALAKRAGADLVTTDANLHQVAHLQGVRVLNPNRLADAMKAAHLPGETLDVEIVRPGKEAGQGLAYLDDGTMIVVEDAASRIGDRLRVAVTSTLQTQVGRMVFAKPAREGSLDAAPADAPTDAAAGGA
ncbi:MAG: TRAM domain-containing protein [Trueperaceae bacterium]|nr:TRAM domain-containing protein [Trueperaceae bacterium]